MKIRRVLNVDRLEPRGPATKAFKFFLELFTTRERLIDIGQDTGLLKPLSYRLSHGVTVNKSWCSLLNVKRVPFLRIVGG